jgi:Ca2+-binding RTX toxin-like protein
MSDFTINLADLNKILEQIKIAEAHAAGGDLLTIIGQDAALLPMGLRTVDGTYNQLIGNTNAGAADELFPRLLTPEYRDLATGETISFGPGSPVITNTNYDPNLGVNPPGVNPDSVVDSAPRTISNLIVDQSINNPAALAAALRYAEVPPLDQVAITTAAYAIQAAALAAGAAQAFETKLEQVKALALGSQADLAASIAKLNDLNTPAVSTGPVSAADQAIAIAALADATAALSKANQALAVLNSTAGASAADIAAATAYVADVQAFHEGATQIAEDFTDPVGSGALSGPERSSFLAVISGEAADATTSAATLAGLVTASEAAAEAASNTADAGSATAIANLEALTNLLPSINILADGSYQIDSRSPDIGLSPPNSGWMTLFGQFFDHGLDLVTKGGNGTVYIPLQPDDPLYVPGSPTNFMALTRATQFNTTESRNTTTPFVDQNQTYTSNASHQAFLREYKRVDADGAGAGTAMKTVNTGHLLDGANGGIASWAETKAQALEMLGITLVDKDVTDVPELEVDAYGKIATGPNGFAQVHFDVYVQATVPNPQFGAPGQPQFITTLTKVPNSQFSAEGTATGIDLWNGPVPAGLPALPLGSSYVALATRTGHAFLDDIAHAAAPGNKLADADDAVGLTGSGNIFYDDEMLDSHAVTGDGRGNENIGLTTVHTIFHAEHNRIVEENKLTILKSGDLATINEWLATDLVALPAPGTDLAALAATLDWDGERMFQAARFTTEMQYQHMVFEEFARRIQPNVDPFIFTNSADLDPAIVAEFAHTVYRFGHSMLTDTVDRLDNNLAVIDSDTGTAGDQQILLLDAFLNPQAFAASASGGSDQDAAATIIRGMTRQVAQEIDEFVVVTLRDTLLGLPLDLPALNIARGREQGIPSLNHSREQLYAMTGHADVKPYTSWLDFAQHIKNPESIVNFIAAYGTHQTILDAVTMLEKRAAALELVLGVDANNAPSTITDRLNFLNATDAFAGGDLGGLNAVDLWVGGLAEEVNEFGGQLGSTFNFVFEYQMEHLQNGDRFYYLSRTQGMNFLNQLEGNTFADIIMRNTNLGDLHATHLSAEVMEVPDMILELDTLVAQENYSGNALLDGTNPTNRSTLDPTHDNAFLQAIDPKVMRVLNGVNVATGASVDVNRDGVIDAADAQLNMLKFSGGEHVVLGGTEGRDYLYGDKGIDTLWGDGGNDYLNAGMESDQVFGGDGDDIIEDPFGDDFLRGEAGDDVVVNSAGLDILFGGSGNDFIMAVTDTTEVFAGEGNDFILGGTAPDGLMGNEGDDWIEGGEGFDGLSGENSELFFNSAIIGHDILNGQGNDTDYDGENGDDIMVQSAGIQRNNGMDGFDWAIHKGDQFAADSDLGIRVFDARQALILRDRFDSVEGLSGWKHDDVLTGANKLLIGENFSDALTQAGVDRIAGLRDVIGAAPRVATDLDTDVVFESDLNTGGEIILGGAGSDTIAGNLGDDILDGDAWLNVRIAVHQTKDMNSPVLFSVDSLNDIQARLRSGEINPGQLEAVREILYDDKSTDGLSKAIDVAVFNDVAANYTITTDLNGVTTVTHNAGGGGGGAAIDDGTDRVRNFEVLQFTDQSIILDTVNVTNNAAVSLLTISLAKNVANTAAGPEVGDVLTVGGTVTDADNGGNVPLAGIAFTWQVEQTAGAGDFITLVDPVTGAAVTGTSFSPVVGLAIDGLALRVVGTFRDAHNFPEVVASPQTAPASVPPLPTIAGLIGTPGADILVGTLGADVFFGNGGDDLLFGIGGNDTAVFNGTSANFLFLFTPAGVLEVVDLVNGTETAVFSIENFQFTNTTLTLAQVLLTIPTVATAGADLIIGTSGDDDISGLAGDDTILSLGGVDVIHWNVGDGHDVVNAGNDDGLTGVGTGADRFRIRGNGEDETYDVHSQVSFALAFPALVAFLNGVPDDTGVSLANPVPGADAPAEIIITRTVGGLTTIVAELSGVDDITFNAGGGADTFNLVGDFTGTDLNPATIEIFGEDGDDTVNIGDDFGGTRANFHGGAGHNEINGKRSNDLIDNTVVDTSAGGGGTPPTPVVTPLILIGDATDNLLTGQGGDDIAQGNAGNDMLSTADGSDMLFGGAGDDTVIAGAGNDMAYGEAGSDRMFAGDGNDMVDAGAGDDTAMGGSGNDLFIASINDGNDTYYGDAGIDTLDMSSIIDRIEANLGTGFNGSGYANTGTTHDALWNVENIVTGGGNDKITASGAHNVIDTGAGRDTIVFRSATDADGDTILNFQPGDKIDVTGFMGSVTLVSGSSAAAGQIAVHYENIGGENFTVLDGQSATGDHFQIDIKGHHTLTSSDFGTA